MRKALLALMTLAAPLAAAERSPFAPLPGSAAVPGLVGLEKSRAAMQAAQAAEEAELRASEAGHSQVGIDVNNWSNGDIGIWAPFLGGNGGIDVRMYRPFQRDGDYNISGSVERESMTGDARERFRGDPSSGYTISGFGYHAWLDRFGRDWRLNGSCDVKDADGRKRRVSFNYIIDRVWSDGSEWRVNAFGLNVNIRTTSWSARIDGSYDPTQTGTMPLAILSMATGLINQERLRQDPKRP